ncbi:MAG: hypothetical protein RSA79_02490 [Oscillospiraceae bacterium]
MRHKVKKILQKTSGFTVVEYIVIISVIAVVTSIGILVVFGQIQKNAKVVANQNANEIAKVTTQLIKNAQSAGTIKDEENLTLADKKTVIKMANKNDDAIVHKVREETGIKDGKISIKFDKDINNGKLSLVVKQVYYISSNGKIIGEFENK